MCDNKAQRVRANDNEWHGEWKQMRVNETVKESDFRFQNEAKD